MRFNTTYTPNLNLKKTIKQIDNIKNIIVNFYKKKLQLIEVFAPSIVLEDDEKNIDFDVITRRVSFDISEKNKIATNIISYTNWAQNLLRKINVNKNEGIYFLSNSILRDLPENTNSSVTRSNLSFIFRIDNKSIDEIFLKLVKELYFLIYEIAQKIEKEINIKNIYPSYPLWITTQQMENELPNLTAQERENDFIIENDAMILQEVGAKMFSGKTHSIIPKQVYDLKKFSQIILKDRINTQSLVVASIGIIASGKKLVDQLSHYKLNEILSNPFYKKISQDETKFGEIIINIPRLALTLLSKAHICEVQPEVFSREAKTIKDRNSIEKY